MQKTHKCKSCRSRQELSHKFLIANIGFDTAENGPLKVYQKQKFKKKLEQTQADEDIDLLLLAVPPARDAWSSSLAKDAIPASSASTDGGLSDDD